MRPILFSDYDAVDSQGCQRNSSILRVHEIYNRQNAEIGSAASLRSIEICTDFIVVFTQSRPMCRKVMMRSAADSTSSTINK